MLRSISGIYALDEEKLSPYFLGEESLSKEKQSLGAKNVVQSLQAHRRVSLERFIAGFDIEGIGETVVEKLTEAGYGSLEKILALTQEEAASVYGFADIMAKTPVEGLAETIAQLVKAKIAPPQLAKIQTFVFNRVFGEVFRMFQYNLYGTAFLLGINHFVGIGHGRSDKKAFKNAILRLKRYSERNFTKKIADRVQAVKKQSV